jgi:hypothetical protein
MHPAIAHVASIGTPGFPDVHIPTKEIAMTRHALALFAVLLLLGPDTTMTQSLDSDHGLAIVIFKYDHTAGIWGREIAGGELHPGVRGQLYRSFPTGPKVVYGDERIPEGIHEGRIDEHGNVSIVFATWPGMPEFNEVYRITGATLDRNVIPMRDGFEQDIRTAALAMKASGYSTIPVIILPGTLEPEVAEMLGNARNTRKGQTLDDVEHSVRRWKPVEEYLIRTGRIPLLRFDEDRIIIEEDRTSLSTGLAGN